jgi:hypothetical protein
MKPVVLLLLIIALPVIAPFFLGMIVALGAVLIFAASAPITLLRRSWGAILAPSPQRYRRFALEAIYGAHRYERLRRYWFVDNAP